MSNMGPGRAGWVVPGIALPATQPVPIPRVHPSPARRYPVLMLAVTAGTGPWLNSAVGLISVAQLSLYTRISGFQGMTDLYNLVRIGRINNHYAIRGFK